jgi:hypothetical protein
MSLNRRHWRALGSSNRLPPICLATRHHGPDIRAILLARATAASLRGLRSSSCNNQADADCLPGLATRIEQTRMAGAFREPFPKGSY